MFNIIIHTTNITLSAIWLAFILALLSFIPGDYNSILVKLGVLLLAIHLIEYVVVKLKTGKKINFLKLCFSVLVIGYL